MSSSNSAGYSHIPSQHDLNMAEKELSSRPHSSIMRSQAGLMSHLNPSGSQMSDLAATSPSGTPTLRTTLLPSEDTSGLETSRYPGAEPTQKGRSRRFWVFLSLGVVIIVAVVVFVIAYFTIIKAAKHSDSPHDNSSSNPSAPASSSAPAAGANLAVMGGDGSTVTREDGSTFVYRNQFGGYCRCFLAQCG
jgi:glucan 1,3-beta-glucosidase